MKIKKIGRLFGMVSVSLMLALSGCGSSEKDNSVEAIEEEKPTENLAENSAEEKVVTVLVSTELNPEETDTIFGDTADFRLYELVYDPLVRYGAGGEIEACLAESWEISEDGREYTFHLRKDVKFSDGTEFNADNVIFNAGRWEDKQTFSSKLQEVKKIDNDTVTFVFEDAAYPCLIEFTYPRPYRMLGENGVDEQGNFKEMIGTGQWMIESYDINKEVVFVPNPYYFGEKPKVDKIVLKMVSDGQARTMAMQSEEADISMSDLPSENMPVVMADENLDIFEVNGTLSFYLILNYDHETLQDQNIRQALNYAIDKESLVKDLLDGEGKAATGLFTPNTPYVTEENSPGYAYDLERAKELLKASGYEDTDGDGIVEKNGEKLSLRLVFQTEEYANWKTICEYLQSEYAKAGIEIELVTQESAAYYDAIWSTRDYDMVLYRTYEDSWNPHGFLGSMFVQTEGNPAVSWYDETLSNDITTVLRTIDEEERTKLYDAIFTRMNEQAVCVPLYYPAKKYVYNKRLTGLNEASTSYEGIVWGEIDILP